MAVNLGDKVKDTVTGFTGIAVSQHIYLQGCHRFTVQPLIKEDGMLPTAESFDGPQLEVIEKWNSGLIKKDDEKDPGGPERFMDKGREV
ncbi:MAG: hypothetical protein GY834_08275 [Bacteroidetes bacterium]|nr:hypothetical protein [Bacteroidota bacterium]